MIIVIVIAKTTNSRNDPTDRFQQRAAPTTAIAGRIIFFVLGSSVRDDLVWIHPLRARGTKKASAVQQQQHRRRRQRRHSSTPLGNVQNSKNWTEEACLAHWSVASSLTEQRQHQDNGDSDVEEEEEDDDDSDEGIAMNVDLAGMRTVWDDTGVAVMAAAAWLREKGCPSHCITTTNSSTISTTMVEIPQVYTPTYRWQLWFPHVAALLRYVSCGEGSSNDDEDDEEDDFGLSATTNGRVARIAAAATIGYALLGSLLKHTPNYSLPCPAQPLSPPLPDHPLETLQLLSLRMVTAAAAAAAATANAGVSLLSQPLLPKLPTSAQAFQLMRALLQKYSVRHHVAIVRHLLPVVESHHESLVPKVLDLLRGMVVYKSNRGTGSSCRALEYDKAVVDLWEFLEPFLFDLQQHVREKPEKDSSTNSSNSDILLVDVDTLVASVERYQSVIGLLELWLHVKKTLPGINLGKTMGGKVLAEVPSKVPSRPAGHHLLQGPLQQILNALQEHEEKTNRNKRNGVADDSSENDVGNNGNQHRLHLLASCLESTISLMNGLP